jgi:hypothetical protein
VENWTRSTPFESSPWYTGESAERDKKFQAIKALAKAKGMFGDWKENSRITADCVSPVIESASMNELKRRAYSRLCFRGEASLS